MLRNGIFTAVQIFSSPIILKTKTDKFSQTENKEIADIRQRNWNYTTTTTGKDKLFEDVLNPLFRITINKQKFKKSNEYKPLKKKVLRAGNEANEIEKAFKEFLKKVIFIDAKDFNSHYAQLTKAWRSEILGFLRHVICHPIRAADYECEARPTANITYKNATWYIELTLSKIAVVNKTIFSPVDDDTPTISYQIPGKITVSFILDGQHFRLLPETYLATQPLLDQFCLKNIVQLNPEILKKQDDEAEQEFQNNLYTLQVSINTLQASIDLEKTLQGIEEIEPAGLSEKPQPKFDKMNERLKSAQTILNEVIKARSNFGSPSLAWLNKVLKTTNTLLGANKETEESEKSELRKLIAEAQKYSWGKILVGALLCFAGTFLIAVSCAAAAGSLGTAAGASILGFIGGGAMLGIGGSMLFTANKKNPLLTTTKTFVKAVENTNDDDVKPKSATKRRKLA